MAICIAHSLKSRHVTLVYDHHYVHHFVQKCTATCDLKVEFSTIFSVTLNSENTHIFIDGNVKMIVQVCLK